MGKVEKQTAVETLRADVQERGRGIVGAQDGALSIGAQAGGRHRGEQMIVRRRKCDVLTEQMSREQRVVQNLREASRICRSHVASRAHGSMAQFRDLVDPPAIELIPC